MNETRKPCCCHHNHVTTIGEIACWLESWILHGWLVVTGRRDQTHRLWRQ